MKKILFLLLVGLSVYSQESSKVRIEDVSNFLSIEAKQQLQSKIETLQTKGINLSIILVPTLNNESLKEFSAKVEKEWNLDSNSGLFSIAINDRKFRISVGKQLKSKLSEQTLKNIQDEMVPYFKDNLYYLGVLKGIDRVEYHFTKKSSPIKDKDLGLLSMIFNLLILTGIILLLLTNLRKKNNESLSHKILELKDRVSSLESKTQMNKIKDAEYFKSYLKTYFKKNGELSALKKEVDKLKNKCNFLEKFDEVHRGK